MINQQRAALILSLFGLVVMVAAMCGLSVHDPNGVFLRLGMVLTLLGAAMWLPWQGLLPASLLLWALPNAGRALIAKQPFLDNYMAIELPAMLALAAFVGLAREAIRNGASATLSLDPVGVDPETGVYEERLLRPAIEGELSRSRRFRHSFALLLVGVDEMRQRFDYRDETTWQASLVATARLLSATRVGIDRVYRLGGDSFALILPESDEEDVTGLVRRLRRVARLDTPAQGEPGGPLPIHFGATFYPTSATTSDDLLRRAEIALKLAEKSSARLQLDGAAAPEMAPPETLRRPDEAPGPEPTFAEPVSGPVSELRAVLGPRALEEDDDLEPELALPSPELPAAVEEIMQPAASIEDSAEPAVPEPVAHPVVAEMQQVPAVIEEPLVASASEPVLATEPMLSLVEPLPLEDAQEPVTVAAPVLVTAHEAAETPATEAASPAPVAAGQPLAPIGTGSMSDASLDELMTQMLSHLNQTLDVIKSLKSDAA